MTTNLFSIIPIDDRKSAHKHKVHQKSYSCRESGIKQKNCMTSLHCEKVSLVIASKVLIFCFPGNPFSFPLSLNTLSAAIWKNVARMNLTGKDIHPLTVMQDAYFEKSLTDYNFLIKGYGTKVQENH